MSNDRSIIIGASTAGLFAAYLLARKCIPVTVFEEREVLGDDSRILIVTGKLAQVLEFNPIEAVVNRVDRIEVESANRQVQVRLQEPDLVIERRKLIELLAAKASQEGAEIALGCRFLGFVHEGGRLIVTLEDSSTGRTHSIPTNTLVGADGVFSKVAKVASRDSRETVDLAQAKVVMPDGMASNCIKVWFDRRQTQYFYWMIPESAETAVIGLICNNGVSARHTLESFLETRGYEPLELQVGQVSMHRPFAQSSRAISGSKILLIGDAGGQVKASTVGGLVAGLRGARAAVAEIAGDSSYRGAIRPLRRELDLHHMLRALLNRFEDRDYDRLLESLNGRAKSVLAVHNRDELGAALLKLLVAQPRLLLVAARSLLQRESPHRSPIGQPEAVKSEG